MTGEEIESCWRAIRMLQMFRLDEAARRTGLDRQSCADYLQAFIDLGLLDRVGDLYHPVRRRDRQLKVTVTHLWADIEDAADWTGLDEKTCAEHLEAFTQLGMLARTGDLYHPVRRHGDRLKVMMVACLWDDVRGIVGEPMIEEAKR
jgi:hypothetical protein